MLLLSCVNCCYNGLQTDTLGPAHGYCVEHKKVLLSPSELTCGRLLRKDLPLATAEREQVLHEQRYTRATIASLRERKPVNGTATSSANADLAVLRRDPVGYVVADYGRLDTKFATLAQLRAVPGPRAEVALFSLGRAYVGRCVERKGSWTSGLHLLWWARERLSDEPKIELADLRVETPVPLARQIELAKWVVIMLRLTFISDVGRHAALKRHRVAALETLAEDAVVATHALDPGALLRWLAREGRRRFDASLSARTYERLASELHEGSD